MFFSWGRFWCIEERPSRCTPDGDTEGCRGEYRETLPNTGEASSIQRDTKGYKGTLLDTEEPSPKK